MLVHSPFWGFRVLVSAVIKIRAILRAKTVITGAKITDIILASLICSPSLKSLGKGRDSLNVSSKTINGDAAITTHRKPTLAINTTQSAKSGKNNIRAKAVLMSISPDTLPKLCPQESDISAKLSSEE